MERSLLEIRVDNFFIFLEWLTDFEVKPLSKHLMKFYQSGMNSKTITNKPDQIWKAAEKCPKNLFLIGWTLWSLFDHGLTIWCILDFEIAGAFPWEKNIAIIFVVKIFHFLLYPFAIMHALWCLQWCYLYF